MRCSSTPTTAPPKTQANTMAATASALIPGPSARRRCSARQHGSCGDPLAADCSSQRRVRSQGKFVAATAEPRGPARIEKCGAALVGHPKGEHTSARGTLTDGDGDDEI